MVFRILGKLHSHPAITKPKAALEQHRYSMPLFILRETLAGFQQHNGFGTAAAISFYAMFALIPMGLLIFFLLSHYVMSSNSAIVRLTLLTTNLVPKYSHHIMNEVYHISKHGAVWGVFGVFAMLSASIPLASALRTSFHTIAAIAEPPSFIRSKVRDMFVVVGILLLFFLSFVSGLMVEKLLTFFHLHGTLSSVIITIASLVISTFLIAVFYRAFFPGDASFLHILTGSLLTAALWMAIYPTLFELFQFINQSYSTIFGGMKNILLSMGWLYYDFAVFLLGTELIATLRKKDVLLLRELFRGVPSNREAYLRKLIVHFGRYCKKGEFLFHEGDHNHDLYYIVSGDIVISHQGSVLRKLGRDEYFGEMAFLTDASRIADAIVTSERAEILIISKENLETLLLEEPGVAMTFLKEMAFRLKQTNSKATQIST